MANKHADHGHMTVAEAGKKGGETTAATHGREFYQEIGHKGGQKGGRDRHSADGERFRGESQ